MSLRPKAVNQSAPSGPVVISLGRLPAPGTWNSLTLPAVVMRPISPPRSTNQSAPSGPAVIPNGEAPEVGMGNSLQLPPVVTRPVLLPLTSVDPSAPAQP